MLPGQKPKKQNFHNIVESVFTTQTLKTTDGRVHYAKDDIQDAREAYDKFTSSKTIETLKIFQDAVIICAENNRSGFDKLEKLLPGHPLLKITDAIAQPKNDTSKKL